MAGGTERPSMSVEELEYMVRAAGMEPVERDSHYNVVVRNKPQMPETESVEAVAKNEKTENPVENRADRKSMAENKIAPKRVGVKRDAAPKAGANSEGTVARFWSFCKWFYRHFRIVSHIIIIGIFCLALLIVLYFGLKRGTRHNETIVVPNFVGMLIDDARGVADDTSLNIVVRDSIFDVDLPGGTIVDQLPGTSDVRDVTVKPGRKIYVTINAYTRRQVDVPYVAKQTLRQALNQLERSGLTVDKLVYEADMTSTDYVEKQVVRGKEVTPSSKRTVPVGTGVTLYVTYHRNDQNTMTPRVVGLSLAKAKSTLWDHGLNVGNIKYDESVGDIIERRTARVYMQSSAIGSSQRRGSKVDIYLSADDALVDSLRLIADKDAERAESKRRKEQLAKQREADSLAALGITNMEE
jgi:beta-lactam-binding protein with PASTA domain